MAVRRPSEANPCYHARIGLARFSYTRSVKLSDPMRDAPRLRQLPVRNRNPAGEWGGTQRRQQMLLVLHRSRMPTHDLRRMAASAARRPVDPPGPPAQLKKPFPARMVV